MCGREDEKDFSRWLLELGNEDMMVDIQPKQN